MMMLIAMALLVGLGLWAFVHVAPHWGLVDQPNSRSLHTTPTVVSGGIVPMLVLSIAVYTNIELSGSAGRRPHDARAHCDRFAG